MKKAFTVLSLFSLVAALPAQAGTLASFEAIGSTLRASVNRFAASMGETAQHTRGAITGTVQRDAYVVHLVPHPGYGDAIYKVAVALEETTTREVQVSVKMLVTDTKASDTMHIYLSERLVREIESYSDGVSGTARQRVVLSKITGQGNQVTVNLTGMAEGEAQDVIRTIDNALDALLNEGTGVQLRH